MPRRARPPSLRLATVPIPPRSSPRPFSRPPPSPTPPPVPSPARPPSRTSSGSRTPSLSPVSPSPSESSGSLLNAHPPKLRPQLYPRPIPQSPPIVISRPRHTHVRGHTCPEAHLTNFSNYRNPYSHSGSSSEPQSPLSSSSSSCRSPFPYRPPDAVDTRPPRRLKSSHVRIHSDSVLSTHPDSFCSLNLRRTESSLSEDMEFGCGPAASD